MTLKPNLLFSLLVLLGMLILGLLLGSIAQRFSGPRFQKASSLSEPSGVRQRQR